jgi:hypothetical protein
MHRLATLLDLRLWVPKGTVNRRPKVAVTTTAATVQNHAPQKLQRPIESLTPTPSQRASLPTASIHQETKSIAIAAAPQQRLRIAMTQLTPTLLLMVESSPNDGDAEHQLLHNLLQAIQKHQHDALPPLKYFQWPPATRSSLKMGKLEDALSGLLHQVRAQGCTEIVILNHQLHRLLISDPSNNADQPSEQPPELHCPLPQATGCTLFFSHSLQAMQLNPPLKKAFWFFLTAKL